MRNTHRDRSGRIRRKERRYRTSMRFWIGKRCFRQKHYPTMDEMVAEGIRHEKARYEMAISLFNKFNSPSASPSPSAT